MGKGYRAIGEKFGNRAGFHSALVAHEITSVGDRWDEVEYMIDSVHANIPGPGKSVVVDFWHSQSDSTALFIEALSGYGNDIFLMDAYPFKADTPGSGAGFQSAVDIMARHWGGTARAIKDNDYMMDHYCPVISPIFVVG